MISTLARKTLCIILLAGYGLSLQAQGNAVSNPGFDTSLSGWEEFAGEKEEWSAEDANGSADSGSALLYNQGTSDGWVPLVLHQCIEVEANQEYEFGGDVMVPPGQPKDSAGYIYVQPFPNHNCFGGSFAFQGAGSSLVGSWKSAHTSFVTPPDTQSVQLSMGVFKTNGESADAQAHFDNIYFMLPEAEEPEVPEEPQEPEEITVNPSMSASWFNPAEAGHGIMIHLLDANTAWMCWFTFDREGNPVWICAMGVIEGDTITFEEAFTIEGGAFPPNFDPELITEVPWGSIVVQFTGCDTGVMSWNTSDMRFASGEMPIERLTDLWDVPCPGP